MPCGPVHPALTFAFFSSSSSQLLPKIRDPFHMKRFGTGGGNIRGIIDAGIHVALIRFGGFTLHGLELNLISEAQNTVREALQPLSLGAYHLHDNIPFFHDGALQDPGADGVHFMKIVFAELAVTAIRQRTEDLAGIDRDIALEARLPALRRFSRSDASRKNNEFRPAEGRDRVRGKMPLDLSCYVHGCHKLLILFEVHSYLEAEAEVHDVREFFLSGFLIKQGCKPSGGGAGRPGRSAAF